MQADLYPANKRSPGQYLPTSFGDVKSGETHLHEHKRLEIPRKITF